VQLFNVGTVTDVLEAAGRQYYTWLAACCWSRRRGPGRAVPVFDTGDAGRLEDRL
jgi:hypothetical protein